MEKRFLLLLSLVLTTMTAALAQRSVSGMVKSSSGEPLIGVNVIEVGTSKGTITDVDGNYTISVGEGATLEFTYTGYQTLRIAVGGQSRVDATMEEGVELSEVVITALGISREKKALTYAAQTISGDAVNEVRDANFVNTLSGKAAGIVVTQAASGPGGAARVILRGNRSIARSNNALFVVDGVPFNNSQGGQVTNDFGGYNGSDGVVNINPDDIESITILKGASAAALYGNQAANGVIMITTKKGKAGKISVDVNSGVSMEQPFILPALQNTYGQGNGGAFGQRAASSWGPAMSGQQVTDWTGKNSALEAQPDNIKDFFRNAISTNQSVGITGGTEKIQTYLSYSYNSNQGIIPQNDLERHTLNLRLSNQITDRLSADVKVTYVNQFIDNKIKSGEEGAVVMNLYKTPRSVRYDDMANFEEPDAFGQPTPLYWTSSSIYMNPFWSVNRTSVDELRNRIIGLASVTYKLTDWLNIMGRFNMDRYTDAEEQIFYDKTLLWAQTGGTYSKSFRNVYDRYMDLLISGNNSLGESLKLSYNLGTSVQKNRSDFTSAQAAGLLIPNKFDLGFARTINTGSGIFEQEVQSVFGTAQLGYKDYLYLDVTARNDWSSTLPAPHAYFFPSVGITAVLSDMVALPEWTSFAKIRASYAQVGNGAEPYRLNQTYSFNQGGANGFITRDAVQAIPNLKPELTNSLEVGIDWRLFNNRLGFDFTWYKTNTINQLLVVGLPPASGFSGKYINVGDIENSGIELTINATPVEKSNFSWDAQLNFTQFNNKVIKLDENIKQAFLSGAYGRTAGVLVVEGGSYGDLYAPRWLRDANDNFVVDANGRPVQSASEEFIGNFMPDFTLGLRNTFNFSNLSVSFLLDGRVGGVVTSGTDANLAFDGNADYTTAFRDGGWVLPGVVQGTGETNTTAITAETFWTTVSGGRYSWGEFFTYDATNFRIRELSVGYDFKVKSNFIKNAKLSLVARNLVFLYRGKATLDIPGVAERKLPFDPDVNLGAGNYQGIEYGNLPSTRTIGLNLKLGF